MMKLWRYLERDLERDLWLDLERDREQDLDSDLVVLDITAERGPCQAERQPGDWRVRLLTGVILHQEGSGTSIKVIVVIAVVIAVVILVVVVVVVVVVVEVAAPETEEAVPDLLLPVSTM